MLREQKPWEELAGVLWSSLAVVVSFRSEFLSAYPSGSLKREHNIGTTRVIKFYFQEPVIYLLLETWKVLITINPRQSRKEFGGCLIEKESTSFSLFQSTIAFTARLRFGRYRDGGL